MTRGTFYFIDDAGMHASTEFNGDMYPEGHGDEGWACLAATRTLEEFEAFVRWFNKDRFDYPEKELVEDSGLSNEDQFAAGVLDFNDEYYTRYFSDWIFFVNRSGRTFRCLPHGGGHKPFDLAPGRTMRLCFGDVPRSVPWMMDCPPRAADAEAR